MSRLNWHTEKNSENKQMAEKQLTYLQRTPQQAQIAGRLGPANAPWLNQAPLKKVATGEKWSRADSDRNKPASLMVTRRVALLSVGTEPCTQFKDCESCAELRRLPGHCRRSQGACRPTVLPCSTAVCTRYTWPRAASRARQGDRADSVIRQWTFRVQTQFTLSSFERFGRSLFHAGFCLSHTRLIVQSEVETVECQR